MALLNPYTLKARFYFAVAHLRYQASAVRLRGSWSDDFSNLSQDRAINEEWAFGPAKPSRLWRGLFRALNKVDDGNFKSGTDEFRSKHTHRFIVSLGSGPAFVALSDVGSCAT